MIKVKKGSQPVEDIKSMTKRELEELYVKYYKKGQWTALEMIKKEYNDRKKI